MDVARKNLLENVNKSSFFRRHERAERHGSKMLQTTTRTNFHENYKKDGRERAAIRDHPQEKLIATGIMEKVRMLQENQNQEHLPLLTPLKILMMVMQLIQRQVRNTRNYLMFQKMLFVLIRKVVGCH